MLFTPDSYFCVGIRIMRKKIVAGNWKMNLLKEEAQALTAEIIGMIKDEESRPVNVILFPPFLYINALTQQANAETRISIGAQNCSDKLSGAYTGEVSASMLASLGCKYVLVGHSERRSYYGETNQSCATKIDLALQNNISPIYCIGETLNERESGIHFDIIKKQLEEGIFHLNNEDFSNCIIAYEPVWAIGTGKTASSDQAQEIHKFIRQTLAVKYGNETAENCSILYGGSCNDQNAKELFNLPDVDGGLIGGASLKSRSFTNIIKSLP